MVKSKIEFGQMCGMMLIAVVSISMLGIVIAPRESTQFIADFMNTVRPIVGGFIGF